MGFMRQAVQIKRQKLARAGLIAGLVAASSILLPPAQVAAAQAQQAPAATAVQEPTYTAIADLTLRSEVVLTATIRKMQRISPKDAPDIPAGHARFIMRANVTGVLLAPQAIPMEISYVWDAPLLANGKAPNLKGESVLLFLRTVPGNDRIYQLATYTGQLRQTEASVSLARAVAADPIRPGGFDYRVSEVIEATRLQRHSEETFATHFLIQTAGKGLMTVSVPEAGTGTRTIRISMPDNPDESRPLVQQSLVAFFLACGLPERLPGHIMETANATGDAAAIAADYRLLRREVGQCR